MYCKYCGSFIQDENPNFCRSCGKQIGHVNEDEINKQIPHVLSDIRRDGLLFIIKAEAGTILVKESNVTLLSNDLRGNPNDLVIAYDNIEKSSIKIKEPGLIQNGHLFFKLREGVKLDIPLQYKMAFKLFGGFKLMFDKGCQMGFYKLHEIMDGIALDESGNTNEEAFQCKRCGTKYYLSRIFKLWKREKCPLCQ